MGLTLLTLINIRKSKSIVEGALRQINRVFYELIPNRSKKNE
jgi:trans-2-enoyl-CoA reductase